MKGYNKIQEKFRGRYVSSLSPLGAVSSAVLREEKEVPPYGYMDLQTNTYDL